MSRKVTAPVARSTAYDFNAQLAKCHLRNAGSIDSCMVEHAAYPESRDVMPHEILFATRKDVSSGDSRLRCMSSLNGVKLNDETIKSVQDALLSLRCPPQLAMQFDNTVSAAGRKDLLSWLDMTITSNPGARETLNNTLSQNFVYIGIAITPCKAGNTSALQRQGFSATRGGLMTVINTGKHVIKAGQKVKMVIDVCDVVRNMRGVDEQLDGVPRQKILARIEPAHDSLDNTFEQVLMGVNTSSMTFTTHEPFALTPDMKYVSDSNGQE